MKIKIAILIACISLLNSLKCFSQQKENDYVKVSATGILNTETEVSTILSYMKKQDNNNLFLELPNVFKDASFLSSPDVKALCTDYILDKGLFIDKDDKGNYDLNKNAAIIVMFRNIKRKVASAAGVDGNGVNYNKGAELNDLTIDATTLNTIIYHKDAIDKWSNYLLTTKNILVVYVDLDDEYYTANDAVAETQLSNSMIKINYHNSFFKQSFLDLKTVIAAAGTAGGTPKANYKLRITLNLIDPKQIKAPCDIVVQNKTFAKDQTFPIHEKNFASFQVGVVNNKYKLNQFSIQNDSLRVTPDSAGKADWKSNVYAVLELHLPRDIDNFQPIWKVAFGKNPYHNKPGFGRWAYNMTLDRIGIYGGLKIDKDPLSNLYAGFNYAISKELSVNFGWSWKNEVTPQVTAVGDITSISDALKYAKRSYSQGQFSWGLSFAPSQILSMFGSKDK